MTSSSDANLQRLNDETRAAWDANAAFWDEKMGEGNMFQRLLVGPASERLLEIAPGELVLEIACGNGVFTRRLAALGARVLATDFSAPMIERAQARAAEHHDTIEYRHLDATDEQALLALGAERFDAIVSNMALMDMAAIEPLMRAARVLLKPAGRLVYTLLHPCFNHSDSILVAEEQDREGDLVTTYSVKLLRYKNVGVRHGVAMAGQPKPQLYFHRTLSDLLSTSFRAGLVMDGIEEPTFTGEEKSPRALNWTNFLDIPPVLAVRMRRSV